MRTITTVVCLVLTVAVARAERDRPLRGPATVSLPSSVLWVAAHPDDEALVAPLLAHWCLDQKARCGFLVLTRGENGACLLSGGCHPDTGSVRSAEAGAASALFEADLMLLRIPDGSVGAWAPDLIATVAGHIAAFRPETVMTFDPRHGTTCHPDHREVGRIVLESLGLLSNVPEVLLLETRVDIGGEPLVIRFAPAVEEARVFDADALLRSTSEPAWNMMIEDMGRHPSQFDAAWIQAIERIPSSQRRVWYGPADEMLARPAGCPAR